MMANPSGNYWNQPIQYGRIGQERFPEDMEESDRQALAGMVDRYFDSAYPEFEPEIVYAMEKEYFLPALKVLKFVDGKYFSPGYEVEWRNLELKAECRKFTEEAYLRPNIKMITDNDGNQMLVHESPELTYEAYHPHPSPHEDCDCGIYGSVNLEEVFEYMKMNQTHPMTANTWRAHYLGGFDSASSNLPSEPKNILCIIEPSPDAKVIVCRKGWKSSHVFISEIVGETITKESASQLLSIAWKRNIDIRSLYENR